MCEKEEWKQVVGCAGYEVSNFGRVRSFHKQVGFEFKKWEISEEPQRILKSGSQKGYGFVCIMCDGKQRVVRIYKLVANAFIGPCPEGMEICHNDSNPDNDRASNLRYDTHQGNMCDRYGLYLDDIVAIRERCSRNENIEQIASSFNCDRSMILSICVGRICFNYGGDTRSGFGLNTSKVKATFDIVENILRMRSDGKKLIDISHRLGVGVSYVSRIWNGERRQHAIKEILKKTEFYHLRDRFKVLGIDID